MSRRLSRLCGTKVIVVTSPSSLVTSPKAQEPQAPRQTLATAGRICRASKFSWVSHEF